MFEFKHYKESAEFIKSKIGDFKPEILLMLGSGLGYMADEVEDRVAVNYEEIPHFKVSTAPGHAGKFVFGRLSGKNVAVMQGRLHLYEGHTAEEAVFPLRTARLLGASSLIVTNACGGVNTSFKVGDLMIIKDHIKLFHMSPLIGQNIPEFGVRFPDSTAYTPEYIQMAEQIAGEKGIDIKEGVYFYFPGPQYETPSEVKAARILGGDAVGMSTVPEVIAARHCGMKILGISLITNMAAGVLDKPLTEEEVLESAKEAAPKFSSFIRECVRRMM